MSDLNNSAVFVEGDFGLCELQLNVASKIHNPKRRALLTELALKSLTDLEQVVAKMEYEEVERIFATMKPTNATNGHKELREVEINEQEN